MEEDVTRRWGGWLAAQRADRERDGVQRALSVRGAGDTLLDLAGNDYLGLARHPEVRRGAAEAAQAWGGGAGASRLVTGTLGLHRDLERALAGLTGRPEALVLSSGYAANLAAVGALADRDCLIVSDAHVHASLIDAARLTRAAVTVTPHGDLAAVEHALGRAGDRRALVLAESVYSVLGDAAPVGDLAELCRRYDALLLLDEAHGLGVVGPGGCGALAASGLAGAGHVVVTATLSKALGAQGGVVLAGAEVLDQVVNRGRAFIFDTALAPAAAGAALAAAVVLEREPERPALLARRVATLARRLGVPQPEGAVVSVPMPSPRAAVAARETCAEHGVRVGCFRPPSVPDGVSRVRVTGSAGPAEEDWERATRVVVDSVAEVLAEHGGGR